LLNEVAVLALGLWLTLRRPAERVGRNVKPIPAGSVS